LNVITAHDNRQLNYVVYVEVATWAWLQLQVVIPERHRTCLDQETPRTRWQCPSTSSWTGEQSPSDQVNTCPREIQSLYLSVSSDTRYICGEFRLYAV